MGGLGQCPESVEPAQVLPMNADFRSRKLTHNGQAQGYSKTTGRLCNHGIGRHPLAGRVRAGRTLPLGWAVLPYPWPKGRFHVTTLALVQQLQQAFPVGVHWTLVADRGLPSAALVAQLRQGRTGFRVRPRLSDW